MKARSYSSQIINEIISNLDSSLVEYFNENATKNKNYPGSLEEMVRDIIEVDFGSESDSSELQKLLYNKKKNHSKKKKRYYEACKSMVESRAWEIDDIERYCFKNDILNYRMFTPEQWQKLYPNKTLEEVQQERLAEVEVWSKTEGVKGNLINYQGLEKKTPKQLYSNFKLDLTIEILSVIKRLYNFEIEALTFAVLDDLSDKAIFTVKKEKIVKNEENIGTQVIFTSLDGSRRTVISYDSAGFSDDKDEIIAFDIKDNKILSYLLKAAMRYEGTTMPIMIEKSKLGKSAFEKKKLSQKDYDDIDRRLQKLSHANIDTYIDNKWVSSYNFVDGIELVENGGREYVAFYPSEYMNNQIELNAVSQLPTNLRNLLESNTAKLLFVLLMMQRIRSYKKSTVKGELPYHVPSVLIQYEHFLRYVNFGSGNQKDNRAEICKALDEYKEKKIFLKDYTYNSRNKTYTLDFIDMTDIEIQDISFYYGEENTISSAEGNIQLDVFNFIEN